MTFCDSKMWDSATSANSAQIRRKCSKRISPAELRSEAKSAMSWSLPAGISGLSGGRTAGMGLAGVLAGKEGGFTAGNLG